LPAASFTVAIGVRDREEALATANDTAFGLTADIDPGAP
jgi:acyl-CoA reductase-like NAD-dependent aldehyde dehydrogenase